MYSVYWSGIHRENSKSFSPKSEVAEGIGSIKVVSMYYMYYIFFLFIECLLTNYCIYVQYMPSRIVFCVIREYKRMVLRNAPHFHPGIAGFLGKNSRIVSYEYKANTNNTNTNIPKCKFLGTVQFAQYKQYKQYKTALFAKNTNLQKLTRKIRIPPTLFISRVGDRW